MANHKSAEKRIRNSERKNERNRYQAKTARNVIRRLRTIKDKKEAADMLPGISAMLDKLAKKNVIHKNKAANLKSELALHVNKMS